MKTFPPMRHFVHTYVGPDDRSWVTYEALMRQGEMNDLVDRLASLLVETTDEFSFSFPTKYRNGWGVRVMVKSDYGDAFADIDFSSVAFTSLYDLSCELGDHPIRRAVIRLVVELIKTVHGIKTTNGDCNQIHCFDFTLNYNPKTAYCYTIGVFARC